MNLWGYIAAGVFVLTLMAGSFMYFRWSQAEIAQLNQVVAADKVRDAEQVQTIASLQNVIKVKEELGAKLQEQQAQNHTAAVEEIKKVNDFDLNKISKAHPHLLENIINTETKKMFDDLSKISQKTGGSK